MKLLLIFIIRIYQYFISPWLGQNCRFEPNCSNYSKDAIKHYGSIKGVWLTIKRLSRCHPFYEGGYDPIPEEKIYKK